MQPPSGQSSELGNQLPERIRGYRCPLFFSTEKYNFLGISIVGQSNERGDGGIYIGSIMKGGAVAADGRIEPGDMLLQVSRFYSRCCSGKEARSSGCLPFKGWEGTRLSLSPYRRSYSGLTALNI